MCYNVYNILNTRSDKNLINIEIRQSDNCNGDYSLYLSFRYNEDYLGFIKSLSQRAWSKATKEWEVGAKHFGELLAYFDKKEDIHITGDLNNLYAKPVTFKMPKDFEFKTKPFEHQVDGFKFGLTHKRWLLADEQGLGKTKQVIDIAIAKKKELGYKHCLIVCGVNGLKWNWVNEIHTHSDESAYILGQRTKKNKITVGSMNDRIEDLKHFDSISSYFIITNIETLRNAQIQALLNQLCVKKEIQIVAIDEIHKCKNASSQQGKGIMKLQSECRIAMTGTPIMNTPMDLYAILKWLGYEKHSFYQFKNHYCVMGGFGGYEIIAYKHLDELEEQLKEVMLRRLKEDVLDLPEKLYIDEYVEMSPKQAVIYKEVTAAIKSNIDKIAVSPNPLAELIRMRQATGYTGILSTDILESAKIDRLEDIVDETIANKKKIIIFSNWTQMTTPIYNRLSEKYKGVVITGETNDVERQANVIAFQDNPECKFALGTIGAMGTGITLTAGTVVVFMDEPWTMANKQQAIDRCHRIGTSENITIYTLMCKDTIDERIHDIVEKKGAISDALVDGKIIGNRAEVLNFLLS